MDEANRQLETDDDPERFDERFGKLVKHGPVDKHLTDSAEALARSRKLLRDNPVRKPG